jgi:nickel-dependent lactate racemase
VIIISDHTRPVPSKDILPNMVRELREGNPEIEISFLVATGFHRGTTPEELIDYCKARLAGYKRPKKIDVHETLPRNSSDKVLKTELRKPYWASHQR